MIKKFDLVAVGELNVDLIMTGLEALPQLGKDTLAADMEVTLGGSTALFVLAASKLDLEVKFISKVGNDPFGRFLIDFLKEREVDTSDIIIDENLKTGLSVSLSFPHDRGFATYLGTISRLRLEDVGLEILEQGRHLHLSSYFLQEDIKKDCPQLFSRAKDMGLSTSLDTGCDPQDKWEDDYIHKVFEKCDIFLPNELEALNITQKDTVLEALEELSRYVPLVVIKLGEKGAMAKYKDDDILSFPAFKVKVVDTTGVGDCFDAGFLYGYLNGFPISKCMVFGNACGALAATKMGGSRGMVGKAQIEEFLKDNQP